MSRFGKVILVSSVNPGLSKDFFCFKSLKNVLSICTKYMKMVQYCVNWKTKCWAKHTLGNFSIKRYSASLWLLQPVRALQFLYYRDFGLHGQTSQNAIYTNIFFGLMDVMRKKPNMQICLRSSFSILSKLWNKLQ